MFKAKIVISFLWIISVMSLAELHITNRNELSAFEDICLKLED